MKLLIVAGSGSPWSYRVIETIAALGVEVHLVQVPPEGGEAYINPNDPSWQDQRKSLQQAVSSLTEAKLPPGSKRYFALAQLLRSKAAEIRPDTVLTLYGGGLALAAALSGFRRFAIYAVGSDIHSISRLNRLVSRWALRKAARVFANGAALAASAREVAPGATVESLLLGVNTNVFVPGDPAPTPFRIVCTRGFSPIYNNQAILEALKLIPESALDWQLTFAAGGVLLQECMEWADANLPEATRHRIIFLGGVGPDQLTKELQASHAFISMSKADGTATSLLEALSCGLRPVLSDIPANQEWVCGNPLANPEDPAEIANVLSQAIKKGPPHVEERASYRALILERADAKKNMVQLIDRLSKLSD